MPGRKFFIPLLLLALWFGGRAWYFSPNVSAEEAAPTFSAVRIDGQSFDLEALRGKYVLLDFWGSWCGPCRQEVPQLKALYQQHGERLTIVSIAIEQDSSRWQRALARDGRNWPYQVMDETSSLKFLNGKLADLYGINAVPANVLVDEKGDVVGYNLPLSEVAAAL